MVVEGLETSPTALGQRTGTAAVERSGARWVVVAFEVAAPAVETATMAAAATGRVAAATTLIVGPMVGRVGPARAMAVPEAVAGAAVRHREHTARASRSLDSEIQRSLHSR